jgi:hypothetical protein
VNRLLADSDVISSRLEARTLLSGYALILLAVLRREWSDVATTISGCAGLWLFVRMAIRIENRMGGPVWPSGWRGVSWRVASRVVSPSTVLLTARVLTGARTW